MNWIRIAATFAWVRLDSMDVVSELRVAGRCIRIYAGVRSGAANSDSTSSVDKPPIPAASSCSIVASARACLKRIHGLLSFARFACASNSVIGMSVIEGMVIAYRPGETDCVYRGKRLAIYPGICCSSDTSNTDTQDVANNVQDAFDFSDPDAGTSVAPDPSATDIDNLLDLAAHATERTHGAGGGIVIATVNRRLARHLSTRFVQRQSGAGRTWWETPSILPLSNWLTALHDEALAAGTSQRSRLAPLAARLRWRREVQRRHSKLLDVDSAAREAMRAWRLAHAWHCNPDRQTYLADDVHAWSGWADAYANSLEADQLVDEATLPGHLSTLVQERKLRPPQTLVLAGFISPTPELQAMVAAFEAAGTRVVFPVDSPPAVPRCMSWHDDAEELAAVASEVRQRLDVSPDAVLGVVVPDLDSRRVEVLRAFDNCFFPGLSPAMIDARQRPYDLSAGLPLLDNPVVATALQILTLAWQGLDRHGVSALLLSPYLKSAEAERSDRQSAERTLRDWRVRRADLERFRRRLAKDSDLGAPLYGLVQELAEQREADAGKGAARSVWATRFSAVLKAFGWPGEGLGSEEHQAVQATHAVLDDLQALDDSDLLTVSTALSELKRLARERVFQPETPDVPVRVLGRLESHGQHVDVLWITGLDSERWPAAARPTPFLPVLQQQEVGMPEASPEARLRLAKREFRHWCANAPEVVASHARERDDKPLVAAPVLADILEGEAAALQVFDLVRSATGTEVINDARGPDVMAGTPVRGGARLLEDQAACPFRAFALHRLEIRSLEEAGLGLDARQRGTFLHRALEFFWQETVTHKALLDLSDEDLGERVQVAVDASLSEDEFVDKTISLLERERIARLIREWLEGIEMPRTPFEVEAFEQAVEFEHSGIAINLKIDRVDRVGDARVVIDYKSGTTNKIDSWGKERIANPQLPLYALARDDIDGVAFAQIAREKCRFVGIAGDSDLLEGVGSGDPPLSWEDWRAHWQRALNVVVEEIAHGLAVPTPGPDTCKYCELKGLCRVAVDASLDEDGA